MHLSLEQRSPEPISARGGLGKAAALRKTHVHVHAHAHAHALPPGQAGGSGYLDVLQMLPRLNSE